MRIIEMKGKFFICSYFLFNINKVMSKIILGIDPGIADTGFGLIEKAAGGKISCLAYGSIKTKAGTPMAEYSSPCNSRSRAST